MLWALSVPPPPCPEQGYQDMEGVKGKHVFSTPPTNATVPQAPQCVVVEVK